MIIFLWTKVVSPVFWPFLGKSVITVIALKLKKKHCLILSYTIPVTNLAKYEPNRRTLKNQLHIPTGIDQMFYTTGFVWFGLSNYIVSTDSYPL